VVLVWVGGGWLGGGVGVGGGGGGGAYFRYFMVFFSKICDFDFCRFIVICLHPSNVLLGFKHPHLFCWDNHGKLLARKCSHFTIVRHATDCYFDCYLVSDSEL